jgi:hypothetical protein
MEQVRNLPEFRAMDFFKGGLNVEELKKTHLAPISYFDAIELIKEGQDCS